MEKIRIALVDGLGNRFSELLTALEASPYPLDDVMKLANRAFLPPESKLLI